MSRGAAVRIRGQTISTNTKLAVDKVQGSSESHTLSHLERRMKTCLIETN